MKTEDPRQKEENRTPRAFFRTFAVLTTIAAVFILRNSLTSNFGWLLLSNTVIFWVWGFSFTNVTINLPRREILLTILVFFVLPLVPVFIFHNRTGWTQPLLLLELLSIIGGSFLLYWRSSRRSSFNLQKTPFNNDLKTSAGILPEPVNSPHVYDKAKYHDESIQNYGLPEEHAANHTVVFFRWLIEHHLMSKMFEEESADIVARFRAGTASIHEVYSWWDRCLISDMLSEEGNAFARDYFDFEHGKYLGDYIETLQGKLPSEFHVAYNESNYQKMSQRMDLRYEEWQKLRK